MIKNYLLSFLAMAYMPIMTVLTILVFVCIFTLMNVDKVIMKTVVGILAVLLAIVLLKYNFDKEKIKKTVKKLEHPEEYDDAVMLGKCFFLEERMLAYKKGKCEEYSYNQCESLKKMNDATAELSVNGKLYKIPLASTRQGNKLASFLKKKNPSVLLDGFEETDLNALHDIDSSSH